MPKPTGILESQAGLLFTFVLAACLILAWIITTPLWLFGVHLSDAYRKWHPGIH